MKILSLFARKNKGHKGPGSPRQRASRSLTVFFMTNDSQDPRRIKIKMGAARALGVGAVVLSIAMTFVFYDYIKLRGDSREFYRLKRENASQKIELQSFSSRIRDIESQMARLEIFDKKLRIIAHIDPDTKVVSNAGIKGMGGGSSAERADYLLTPGAKVDELVSQIRSDLTGLEINAGTMESSFTDLREGLMKKSTLLASTPSIRPVKGWITSAFGKRISPFTGLQHSHRGIDIANRLGTPVVATANGRVTKIGRDANVGRYINISHGYGIKTVYGHLSRTFVKTGQRVKRGQKIGSLGNTGRSTGAHLHYAVSVNGVFRNPTKYILN
ncbi:MAG: M23 family metallopeptidase [Thermodesulfobacteriota bacterium]